MANALESGSARRARRQARADIAAQKQKETGRLAEAESEVATKKASATSLQAGRRSLIKTSPTGRALNLGGTNA